MHQFLTLLPILFLLFWIIVFPCQNCSIGFKINTFIYYVRALLLLFINKTAVIHY